ncbi:MAG TPA: CHAT domain-containing protein [Rhizomicrobium sp.]
MNKNIATVAAVQEIHRLIAGPLVHVTATARRLARLVLYSIALAYAQQAHATPTVDDTIHAYLAGDITLAVEDLQQQITSGNDTVDNKINARLFLAQICSELNDFRCEFDNNTEFLKLLEKIDDAAKRTQYFLQIDPSFTEQFVLTPGYSGQDIPKLLDIQNHAFVGAFQSDKYLLLQASSVIYHVQNEDFVGARQAVSRLVARAIVLPRDDYEFPRYLVEIVRDLYLVGDGYHAFLFAQKFDNYIRSTLPANNPTHVFYLELTAELEANVGNPLLFADGKARLAAAESQIRTMRVGAPWRDAALAKVMLAQAELAILSGDLRSALAYQNQNPLAQTRATIQQSGKFGSDTEFVFSLVDLFLSRISGSAIDVHWAPLLSKPLLWETGHKYDEYFRMQREFGLALANWNADRSASDAMLERAAFDNLAQFERSLFSQTHAFPVPNYVSRIIFGMELGYLSHKSNLSPVEKDFAVRAIDVLQRNILHSRGDALYLLSSMKSEKQRRLAHSWLLLADRRAELELSGLSDHVQAFIAATREKKATGKVPTEDDTGPNTARNELVELDHEISALASAINEAGDIQSAADLPTSGLVQSLLVPDEALITESVFFGLSYKLCVGPSGNFRLLASPIPSTLLPDLKILRASYSASYAPSALLDSQYPVEAAMRIRDFVLGGLEDCVGPADRMIYNPIVDLADIPLGALLATTPPREGEVFDLSRADWLIKKYVISNASSVEEFVASRRLSAVAGGELPFLGVGDPALDETVSQGKTGGQILASRGVSSAGGQLRELPELPETGVELKEVAALIQGSSLLLRHDATEDRLTREPLGHFDVIDFATHGLVTGDISGITEPGLVLTPTPETETTTPDNGFLSSTKISEFELRARLVVLSACNTANFEVDQFVGSIRSLSAALAQSGVPTVIASLWPVSSQASQHIMTDFFGQLERGKDRTVAGAFTNGVREFLATVASPEYSHPRFWAPFAVYGDGDETFEQKRQAMGRLLEFDSTGGRGEIGSLERLSESTLLDSRSGDWTGKRFASLVEARTPSGGIKWQVKDNGIGTGQLVVGKSDILVAGYVSTSDTYVTQPLIRSFAPTGTLLWRYNIVEEPSLAFVTDMDVSPAGDLWLVVDAEKYVDKELKSSWLDILVLDQGGHLKHSWKIQVPLNQFAVESPTLAITHSGTLVFMPTGAHATTLPNDDFGQPGVCLGDDGAIVYRLTGETTTAAKVGFLEGVVVRHAKQIGEHLFIAGFKIAKCAADGEPYFGVVKSTLHAPSVAVNELYVERGLLGGEFTGFVSRNGELVLNGNVSNRVSELDITQDLSKLSYATYSGLSSKRIDSFLVELNPAHPQAQAKIHFIDAGSNVFLNGVVADGNDLVLAGSVGFQALWARYALQ